MKKRGKERKREKRREKKRDKRERGRKKERKERNREKTREKERKREKKMSRVNYYQSAFNTQKETSQELRMLSNVTLNCQVAKVVMNSGSQLSEL